MVKQTGRKQLPPGPGRPKGSVNRTTALLKDAIIRAAELTGSDKQGRDGLVGYCRFLAAEEPKAFTQLLGKVLPMQVVGADDANGNPTAIEFRIVDPRTSG